MSRLLQSRRTFLRAAGATALTLPFLRSMPSYADDTEKRYLILLFTANGVVRHMWGADPGASPGTIELRPWLKPLDAYKDKITVVRGLCNKSAGVGDPHGPGMATLWTGSDATGQQGASGPSIDQVIASQLQAPTPYSSIELRAKSPQDYQGKDIYNRMIYSLDAQPLDPREDAKQTLDQLFLGLQGGGGETPELDTKLEVRKRLLTRLDGELGRVQPNLCSEDRQQLEALREAWSGIAKKLATPGTGGVMGCEYPDMVTGDTAFPKVTRDQIELLAMSLACDLTRVASLQFSQALSPMVPDWLGISGDHHNISHMAPHRFELGPNAPVESDADHPTDAQKTNQAIEPLTKIYQFYAGEVAYLCDRLSQFPIGGGKTLLDQCVICWGNELDNGSDHDHWELPFVLIGGGGGKLKTGQVVQYPVFNGYSKPAEAKYDAERAHNDLLVTLAQVMGANVGSIGPSAYNKGPLAELLL